MFIIMCFALVLYALGTIIEFFTQLNDWSHQREYSWGSDELRRRTARRAMLAPAWPYFAVKAGVTNDSLRQFIKDIGLNKDEDARN